MAQQQDEMEEEDKKSEDDDADSLKANFEPIRQNALAAIRDF